MSQPTSKTGRIQQMRQAYAGKNYDLFKSFFTKDALYRPGTVAEIRGPDAILEFYLGNIAATVTINQMDPRHTWEVENAVIVEYDMEITHRQSNQTDRFPCVDIYQFAGDQIDEWRVYPLHPDFVVIKR